MHIKKVVIFALTYLRKNMKSQARIIIAFLIFFLPFTFTSCRKNNYHVNTSGIKADIKIKRLEKDLFTLDPGNILPAIPSLEKDYDGFLQLFSYVINAGETKDPEFGNYLVSFCTDKLNNEVYARTMKVFPDLTSMESEMNEAFRHYLYYFPGKKIPAVYTCITGFNNSIITGDSVLAISLDRYLGADCEYYDRLGIYRYISARMSPGYVLPDCMYGWAASEWDFKSMGYKDDNVLSEMVHQGKLRYFEKCMLPERTDEVLFGFTPDQMKFCRNNETQMWQYLVENDLLFSKDQFTITKLTGEAPFTGYFTNESPGRAAEWIGFRIIESYMSKNPKISFEELMNETDVQSILEKAKYNPE
jgi:hypothetical protein